MTYAIETHSVHHGWINAPEILGLGCSEEDNRWATEADALAAIDELAAVGLHRCTMRVVQLDA